MRKEHISPSPPAGGSARPSSGVRGCMRRVGKDWKLGRARAARKDEGWSALSCLCASLRDPARSRGEHVLRRFAPPSEGKAPPGAASDPGCRLHWGTGSSEHSCAETRSPGQAPKGQAPGCAGKSKVFGGRQMGSSGVQDAAGQGLDGNPVGREVAQNMPDAALSPTCSSYLDCVFIWGNCGKGAAGDEGFNRSLPSPLDDSLALIQIQELQLPI